MFSNNNHRHRQPRHHRSREASETALPPRSWNEQIQAHAWNAQPPQYFADIPSTPPPPYDDVLANPYTYSMPTPTLYQQLAQSQQSLPVEQERKLSKKSSAWASAKELVRDDQQPTRNLQGQKQGLKSSANLVLRPTRRPDINAPIVGTLVQTSAICDGVAAVVRDRLYDAFAHLDQEEDDYDNARNATREATEPHPLRNVNNSSIIDFKKTWLYSNSRLPPHKPPFKVYLETWQLVCSAAQASMDVYRRPKKDEKQDYIDADWWAGTKAMIVNSRPVDDKNLVVIAIRGSKWNVFDWAVNFTPAPTEPIRFLDDEGNACHAGFLRVAKAMVAPIAARLRQLLEQDPSRAASSLLFTGHSAGGAVASLLYMHMVAMSVETELNLLTGCFKRIHCITFGTPPVSFLPLSTPTGKRFEKNQFLSFACEGDPVVRADREYLTTLTSIIASPSPAISSQHNSSSRKAERPMPPWREVPPATLSCAGRLVLLRQKPGSHTIVEAVGVTDEELRDVVFGDLEMHRMELYKERIDGLAIAAVTGRPA